MPQKTSKSEKSKPEGKENSTVKNESSSHRNGKQSIDPVEIVPKVPYPQALEKPKLSMESKVFKILEHLKDLKISLPLIDAILSISTYSKFFKDLSCQNSVIRELSLFLVAFTRQSSTMHSFT